MSETPVSPRHDEPPPQAMEWTVHPVKRRPVVSVVVTVFIVLVAVIVYVQLESPWFAALALIVLFASLAKFYFPTSYRLDEHGVTIRTRTQTLKKGWHLYRSFYPDKNGVFLSPFVERSRLENFRGLYLMCEGNHDQVAAFVREHIGAGERARREAAS